MNSSKTNGTVSINNVSPLAKKRRVVPLEEFSDEDKEINEKEH